MPSKKRRRAEPPSIHPRNRYADSPPDFAALASLYPSFQPHVFYPRNGRPSIDWTDFNATRELTRVLLFHDHGLNWWIPDGQLCPTVPNRSNYIHWIEDLLSSDIIPKNYHAIGSDDVRGFDIGTGANCIYPLLGASLLGWSFVGSDVTDVALEWAEKNVRNNSHVSQLIEIRKVERVNQTVFNGEVDNNRSVDTVSNIIGSMCGEEEGFNSSSLDVNKSYYGPPVNMDSRGIKCGEEQATNSSSLDVNRGVCKSYSGPPVLLGVIKDGERFDFCMCNPPFFESMEEAGLNPKTACGGTQEEMVCPGGEQAFITRIIEDSVVLKQSFRWYTSMVGRKTNLKALIGKLWEFGVTIVKTTEFVQGQTRRWGLAWSFVLPTKKIVSPHVVQRSVMSFMLEGLQRQFSAIHVLQEVESFFLISGASCKTNATLFTVDITASEDHCDAILRNSFCMHGGAPVDSQIQGISKDSSCLRSSSDELCFRILVFQQTPGTLLVKASVQNIQMPVSGAFSLIFQRLEENLKSKFCRENTRKVSSAV